MIPMVRKGAVVASASLALCLAAAACSSSSSSSPSGGTSSSASSSGAKVSISVAQFDRNFTAMAALKPLVSAGKGNVAVILPDTVTSARYVQFDAPYLTQALTAAGLSSSQFTVQNAQGSDQTQLSDAQTAITKGATVLIMDPLDSGVGAQIEQYAKAHGVAVIDYDRLTLGGSRQYYVSFNNVLVGTKIGQGFAACATAWNVSKPNVLVMKGDPTDNNATLFAQGYLGVLNPFFTSGKYVKVGEPAGTWTPSVALSEFQQNFTAHKNINSVLTPNDANTIGLQNILAGYQCGTVYKPIYLEAQAAAALAIFVRAGQKPPATLVNASTNDSKSNASVPSVYLTPKWVTTANMASTVVADKFVTVGQLCVGQYVQLCKTAGIS
jgi:D-xylose transport system substrate-binding protein